MANRDSEKNTLLTAMPVVTLLLWVIFLVLLFVADAETGRGWVSYYSYYMFCVLIVLVLLFSLKHSYRSHTKNVMKGVIGALTVSLIYVNAETVFSHLVDLPMYHEYYGAMFTASSICDLVIFVCMILFTINHFMIQANHHSSPKRIEVNSVLNTIVIFAAIVGFITGELSSLGTDDGLVAVIFLSDNLLYYGLFVTVFSCIMRVETRLDYFRIKREEIKE